MVSGGSLKSRKPCACSNGPFTPRHKQQLKNPLNLEFSTGDEIGGFRSTPAVSILSDTQFCDTFNILTLKKPYFCIFEHPMHCLGLPW